MKMVGPCFIIIIIKVDYSLHSKQAYVDCNPRKFMPQST